ncbi:MAG TPA: hypothetical protein VKS22_09390 [Candidatus Binataceae bacterium]|nr:hypothetical protein [Candidatus Binataceae bacterium]
MEMTSADFDWEYRKRLGENVQRLEKATRSTLSLAGLFAINLFLSAFYLFLFTGIIIFFVYGPIIGLLEIKAEWMAPVFHYEAAGPVRAGPWFTIEDKLFLAIMAVAIASWLSYLAWAILKIIFTHQIKGRLLVFFNGFSRIWDLRTKRQSVTNQRAI